MHINPKMGVALSIYYSLFKSLFKGDKMLDDIIDLMVRVTFLGALICATIGLYAIAMKLVIEGIK